MVYRCRVGLESKSKSGRAGVELGWHLGLDLKNYFCLSWVAFCCLMIEIPEALVHSQHNARENVSTDEEAQKVIPKEAQE